MPRLVFPLAVTRSLSRICRWRALLMATLTVLLALLLFQFPSPGKPGLDPSWEMVLVYAHRHALQFGRWSQLVSSFPRSCSKGSPKSYWSLLAALPLDLSFCGWSPARP